MDAAEKISDSDLPVGLAKPAQRALAGAGYKSLDQFTKVSEAQRS